MNILSIAWLLAGIGMTGQGLMMRKQSKKYWAAYLGIGIFLLLTVLLSLL
jgi:hypothetical protein